MTGLYGLRLGGRNDIDVCAIVNGFCDFAQNDRIFMDCGSGAAMTSMFAQL
jgi:hypothetical protein